jgi:transcriptional regulator with PAS, ATPase and Fis domain
LENHSFFLAACPAMLQLHKNIRKLATVDHPVLILGESGVGKEIIARLLHKYHARPDQKFINVNTAAIPSELLESELFGYEAGAFTGAVKAKPGKFELANRGTLLLDEIGEMSPQMQAKLLHVLQDGTFMRLGGRSSQQVDVRILAATNVNMEDAIAEKRFREDLYYRISTFTLVVPSLRERREEIPLLIEQMALRGAASAGQEAPTFSSRLIEAAQEYHWPGNLRELRNFVTRLLVLQDEDAAYEQLRSMTRARTTPFVTSAVVRQNFEAPSIGRSGMKGVVNESKQQIESSMIKEALLASGWNRRRAAVNLNISYRALLYKIQQHGLSA